jgi:hypothetical protein
VFVEKESIQSWKSIIYRKVSQVYKERENSFTEVSEVSPFSSLQVLQVQNGFGKAKNFKPL